MGIRLNHLAEVEAVLSSTHNLCFGAKIRKIGKPLQTPVFSVYESGVQGGILFMDMFSIDGYSVLAKTNLCLFKLY